MCSLFTNQLTIHYLQFVGYATTTFLEQVNCRTVYLPHCLILTKWFLLLCFFEGGCISCSVISTSLCTRQKTDYILSGLWSFHLLYVVRLVTRQVWEHRVQSLWRGDRPAQTVAVAEREPVGLLQQAVLGRVLLVSLMMKEGEELLTMEKLPGIPKTGATTIVKHGTWSPL